MVSSKRSSVLACVTGQYDCDRIISAAGEMAEMKEIPLHVLCVLKPTENYGAISGELEYLYQTAKATGADMTILFSENAPQAAADFAKETHCRHIVTGMHDGKMTSFLVVFNELRPDIPITMIDKNNAVYTMEPVKQQA